MILQQMNVGKKKSFRPQITNLLIPEYFFIVCTLQVSGILRQEKTQHVQP